MPEDRRATRRFRDELGKAPPSITQTGQQEQEPRVELVFGRQREDKTEERLGSAPRNVGTALDIEQVRDTPVDNAAHDEHAPQQTPRTGLRVEPNPAAARRLGLRIKRESQKLGRPDRLEPALERVPLDRVDVGGTTQFVPHLEQEATAFVTSRGVNARLADLRVRPHGVAARVALGGRSVLPGKAPVARRSWEVPDVDRPPRANNDEGVIANLGVASVTAGGVVRRQLDGVGGRVPARKRRAGLKRRRIRRRGSRLVALSQNVNRGTGRVRAADNSMDEKDRAVRKPLPLDEHLRPPLEPGANLEEAASGRLRRVTLVELRVDLPRNALGIGVVAKRGEEDGIAFDEWGENLEDRSLAGARLPGRGQQPGLGFGPVIGGKHPIDLLRAAVATAEQLETGHP